MKEVKIANYTQAANRKHHKKGGKKKSHRKNKAPTKTANKSTAIARRGVSPAMAKKFMAMGRAQARAAANSTTKSHTKKNKSGRKTRNGSSGGWLSRIFGGGTAIRSNPGLRDFGATFRIAGLGLAGGGLSRLTSAALLAVGDRVAPSWTQSQWASPIVTLLSALFLVPRLMSMVGIREKSSHDIATTGGILFAASEGLNILTNGDKIAEWSTSLRAALGARIGASNHTVVNKTAVAAAAADAARTAAINAGANPQAAQAAAQGALQGLQSLDNVPSRPTTAPRLVHRPSASRVA